MGKSCEVCGSPARSNRCFRHKVQKPIARKTFPKTKKYKEKKPKKTTRSEHVSGRKRSVRYLKAVLWGIFSKYKRLKAADSKGFCKCFTCSNVDYWKFMDAGHFMPRKHTSTFIHEKNVHEQCKGCNQIRNGNLEEYARQLDIVYGEGTADQMRELSRVTKRFSVPELDELIAHYTDELNKLLRKKEI